MDSKARAKTMQGFTLMELGIVLVLVSILATFAVSFWPGNATSVDGQAQRIASDLRYTQNLAMNRGSRYYLIINIGANSYQIINQSTGTAIVNPSSGSTTTTLANGVSFSATNLPNSLVAFDGQGNAYTSTAIPGTAITDDGSISVTGSGTTKIIWITAFTGRIYIS